jgi:hypothetical protein
MDNNILNNYICNICDKKFSNLYNLNRHKNKKIKCSKISENVFKCIYCNKIFKYKSKLLEHNNTKIHKYNISNCENNQINVNGDNINIKQIIQLTLNTNTFANTNLLSSATLSFDIILTIYEKIINNNIDSINKVLQIFKKGVIPVLDNLHFNISNSENHNLKILLMFPKINKLINEYLILEINKETNELVWNSISYTQLLEEIINLLININDIIIKKYKTETDDNKNFIKCIEFLKSNLIDNEELKPEIENMLSDLYIQFNKSQNKTEREIKPELLDKINEYKKYRTAECRLSNGYNPIILNSQL